VDVEISSRIPAPNFHAEWGRELVSFFRHAACLSVVPKIATTTPQSRRISAGDVVIIPLGVPRGFSAIEKEITFRLFELMRERCCHLCSTSLNVP
jgi:hypothetical protein